MGRVARYKKEKKFRGLEDVFSGDAVHDDVPRDVELNAEHANKRHNLKRGRLGLVISSKRALCETMAGVHDKKRKKRKQPNSKEQQSEGADTKSNKNNNNNNNSNNNNNNKNKKGGVANDNDEQTEDNEPDEKAWTQEDRLKEHEIKSKAAKAAKRAKSETDAMAGPRPGESLKAFSLRIGAEARSVINEQAKKASVSVARKKEYNKEKRQNKQDEKRIKRLMNLEKVLNNGTTAGISRNLADRPPEFRSTKEKFNLELDSHANRKRFAKLAGVTSSEAGGSHEGRNSNAAMKSQLAAMQARIAKAYN